MEVLSCTMKSLASQSAKDGVAKLRAQASVVAKSVRRIANPLNKRKVVTLALCTKVFRSASLYADSVSSSYPAPAGASGPCPLGRGLNAPRGRCLLTPWLRFIFEYDVI